MILIFIFRLWYDDPYKTNKYMDGNMKRRTCLNQIRKLFLKRSGVKYQEQTGMYENTDASGGDGRG